MGPQLARLKAFLPNQPLKLLESGRFGIAIHQSEHFDLESLASLLPRVAARPGGERLGARMSGNLLSRPRLLVSVPVRPQVAVEHLPSVIEEHFVDKANRGGGSLDIQ